MRLRGWSVATSWTVVVLWSVVSLGVALAGLTALALPTWFIRTQHPPASFGVWWWSGPDYRQWNRWFLDGGEAGAASNSQHEENRFRRTVEDSRLYPLPHVLEATMSSETPSYTSDAASEGSTPDHFFQVRWSISGGASIWILVGTLYGGAAVVIAGMGLGGPLLLPLLPVKSRSGATRLISNIQAAAVSVQVLSLMLYPLGLGSVFARSVCGQEHTTIYWAGECTMGYGYFLAIVATAVSAYCPVLARLITYRDYAPYWSSINYL